MQSSTKVHAIEVSVNRQPVRLPEREMTGLEIKRAAIAQGGRDRRELPAVGRAG